jgi:hypothetical protein
MNLQYGTLLMVIDIIIFLQKYLASLQTSDADTLVTIL